MKCPACGFETSNPRVAFCPNCGSRLTNDPASPTAPVSPADPLAENDMPRPAADAYADEAAPHPASAPAPISADPDLAPIVKTGNWFGTFLILLLVPTALAVLSGLTGALWGDTYGGHLASMILSVLAVFSDVILCFIFAFGKRFNPSKRNFFKASLLMVLVSLAIIILLFILFSANITSTVSSTELLDLMQQLENFSQSI